MKMFFDTSALLKTYVVERGSDFAKQLILDASKIAVSVLVEPELISSLNRLRREGLLVDSDYAQMRSVILNDLDTFEVVPLSRSIVDGANTLLERHNLRGADAIHLASAVFCRAENFVTSDKRLRIAAASAGFVVVDPCE